MSETLSSPRLAIIVVIYNMRREAHRTLYSLSTEYQLNVSTRDYDVIVVENGSSEPMSPDEVAHFGINFHYIRIEDASPSPAAAINFAVSQTKAHFVGIMIDGARMASPGVVGLALKALGSFERPIVGTIAFHLGPDSQTRSTLHGYNREVEDDLVNSIDWRNNGYRLFDISTLAPSSSRGRFGRIVARCSPPLRSGSRGGWLWKFAEHVRAFAGLAESNLIFLPKALFDELEGFDERFDLPGGGFVNLDFYRRACEIKDSNLITLTGEATFHQVHGGTMSNKSYKEGMEECRIYRDQFQMIRGFPFDPSTRMATVIGLRKPEKIDNAMETCDLQRYVDPTSLLTRVLYSIYVHLRCLKGWLRRLL